MSDRERSSPTLIESGLKNLIGGRDSNYPLISGINGGSSSAGSGGSSAGNAATINVDVGSTNENSQTNSSGSSTSSVGSNNSRVHSSNSTTSGPASGNQWNDISPNHPQHQQQQQHQHQQQQLSQHQHQQQQQQQQQSLSATPLSVPPSPHHHHQHPHHLSAISHTLTQNLPAAANTHSIFGTGNFHYKTNNSWTIPSLSCYQRIYNDPSHYQRSFHPADVSCNPHSNTAASAGAVPPGNENLLSNHHHPHQQQPHHHHHHHPPPHHGGGGGGGGGGASLKRFQPQPTSGKSGNSKEICGDDKFKEDGDPWNVEAQAAFLGPNLWDKTLPYDADLKVTQYADLDEFLSENNIPDGLPGTHLGHSTGLGHRSDSLGHSTGLSLGLGHITTKRERSPSPSDCISPDTLNPPSPAESTFSFASSGRDFDPRTRAFSDEELKPQPMIKKSRKQFVPDELKDDKYWARRRKNNIAAKRSRDARRQKENQIAMRARYLEKENSTLHQEVEQLKQENMDLRARLSKFQDV